MKASAAWCCVSLRKSSSHSEPQGSGQKISSVKAAQGLIWISGLKGSGNREEGVLVQRLEGAEILSRSQ